MNNLDLDLLKKELIHFEGYSLTVYMDTMGNPTVGIGHMSHDLTVGDVILDHQVDLYFQSDAVQAKAIADHWLSTDCQLDDFRYRVIVQLAFNLGGKLFQFINFRKALAAGDWAAAAMQLENAPWYHQVGKRGPETCSAIINGVYP